MAAKKIKSLFRTASLLFSGYLLVLIVLFLIYS